MDPSKFSLVGVFRWVAFVWFGRLGVHVMLICQAVMAFGSVR
ncbi:hypothetical protein RBSH_00675 [Rhodopirellula baltica SH28]|uniref:Uncharacterized protein n=1 Tax=Rhodopirellula baltica SH28 TaxID=993517 RepID=K5DM18_RHOBT|nr:hypothetical protein RBSH_00675 [Rhodopirellula baltica SH28]